MENSEMLIRLKLLLGIDDDSKDALLSMLIEDTINMILGYCRIETLPRQLESFVPIIAADIYRAKGYGAENAPEDIKSISQGERSVSMESKRPDEKTILEDYKARLAPYRNRKGRVPSEVG